MHREGGVALAREGTKVPACLHSRRISRHSCDGMTPSGWPTRRRRTCAGAFQRGQRAPEKEGQRPCPSAGRQGGEDRSSGKIRTFATSLRVDRSFSVSAARGECAVRCTTATLLGDRPERCLSDSRRGLPKACVQGPVGCRTAVRRVPCAQLRRTAGCGACKRDERSVP